MSCSHLHLYLSAVMATSAEAIEAQVVGESIKKCDGANQQPPRKDEEVWNHYRPHKAPHKER